jgi:hypothetical protein
MLAAFGPDRSREPGSQTRVMPDSLQAMPQRPRAVSNVTRVGVGGSLGLRITIQNTVHVSPVADDRPGQLPGPVVTPQTGQT